MSLAKITTPISAAKLGSDGFYTCGNYIAVVSFSSHPRELTVVNVIDHHASGMTIIEEVVIKPEKTVTAQVKQWQKVSRELNDRYEIQRNN